ncbi:MAG: site-specific DNA-methyltransferase, partial [Chloroflexi bacterium]|nr:site-specific DNA-methyltransferase [Chloroflexota bacterium]
MPAADRYPARPSVMGAGCENAACGRNAPGHWRPSSCAVDLSFHDHGRPYATHGLHPFPAKFPPPLARWVIEHITSRGEWVFDPFAGSGTSLVEARLLGRHGLGAEIDPLSCLMARVKATPLDAGRITAAKQRL